MNIMSSNNKKYDNINLERAKTIWVTELNGCPRQRKFRLLNMPELPSHFYQVRGTINHRVAEQILKGEPIKPDFSEMPEAKSSLELELDEIIPKIRMWQETTEIDLSEAEFSVKMEMSLRDGFKLRGELDLLTPEYIVDFKTGRKRNTLSYRIQLLSYREIVIANGLGDRKLRNVFLGDDEPVEFSPFQDNPNKIESERVKLEELIEKNIRYTVNILEGKEVPCYVSIGCTWCRFRNLCRGF